MNKLKTIVMSLALVSGSALAGPVQWNSVDNLVNASNSIATTLNAGIQRVGGTSTYIPTGSITPNGYLEDQSLLLSSQQTNDYNAAILEVQADIFQKTAAEYFGEEYLNAQEAFNVAVDSYVAAATPLAVATHINNMAAQVQQSGDAVQGQQLQAYVTQNNILLTSEQATVYNDTLTVLQDAADQFGAVAAVYNDPQIISTFQSIADAEGVDFLNADGLFLDRIENQGISGFTAAMVVDFTSMNNTMYFQDISVNIETAAFLDQAGSVSLFFLDGPTQNVETTCSTVQNGTIFQTYQTQDPNMPCFLEPAP